MNFIVLVSRKKSERVMKSRYYILYHIYGASLCVINRCALWLELWLALRWISHAGSFRQKFSVDITRYVV